MNEGTPKFVSGNNWGVVNYWDNKDVKSMNGECLLGSIVG